MLPDLPDATLPSAGLMIRWLVVLFSAARAEEILEDACFAGGGHLQWLQMVGIECKKPVWRS